MRSFEWITLLLLCGIFIAVLPVPVVGNSDQHSPTQIVPTKFRFLLLSMMEEEANTTIPMVMPTPTPVVSSVRLESDSDGSADLSAGVKPDSSYNGMGKGFVQTNFDVSFTNPGQKVDNHEVMTARGLFDVHVAHEFNG